MGEPKEALACYETALALDGNCTAALVSLAETLVEIGRPTPAVDCYLRAIAQDPAHVVARTNLATLLRQAGFPEEAIGLLEPIVDRCDTIPSVRFNLANTLADVGRFDEARAHYAAVLPLHPQPAKVLYNLTQVMKFRDGDRRALAEWREIASQRLETPDQQAYWRFALGKAHDDLGEYDAAWPHFAEANRLVPRTFDPTRHAAHIEGACEVFSEATLADRASWGNPVDAPVFIVGMPRSGTSLVEQILASHSQVHAAGERPELGQIVAEWAVSLGLDADDPAAGRQFCPEAAAVMAQRYLEAVEPRPGAIRVTDKMPANFLLLGWIAVCFPRARVIHCRRDPRDTCLSCYFQHFAAPQPFAYDLDHLVAYYRGYERLMDHWRNASRLPILDVDYEALVESPELQTRRLLEFCGLSWEPGRLRSHEHRRAVTTASQWQVRQPVYRTSVGRWRNYARHIGPLLAAFGDE